MALKRVINKHNMKYRTCLACGRQLPDVLKDNTKIKCECCHNEMFVDIYGSSLILTAASHEYLRHRYTREEKEQFKEIDPEALEALKRQIRQETQAELEEAQKKAKGWEDAAEDLAHMVEELQAQKQHT